jgi:cysteine desulfurase/selenocysteine lyase
MKHSTAEATKPVWDVERIREDFPILQTQAHGQPLVYLDNAATTQKPQSVIDAITRYYTTSNANIHRGVHYLAEKATAEFESARIKLQHFIHARSSREIIFTRGTTEAINLVAQSYGMSQLKPGDEIVLTEIEHHSNIVPWQLLCQRTGAVIKVAPMNEQGEITLEAFARQLSERTRIVAITHISNALGTINPVREMTQLAHQAGAKVLIDGAQAAPHLTIDVQTIDCDFYCLSGHKMYGPTGIGILYAREELLNIMPPYQGGGEMISMVTFEKSLYNDLPHKFEAGTPDIAGGIALGYAVDYLLTLGLDAIQQYEHDLLTYATERALVEPDLRLIGTAKNKAAVLSFVMNGIHPHDIGTILDRYGIAVRTGHHCAMPIMQHFDVPATVRASFAFYNTPAEIDTLFSALQHVRELFHP